MEGAWERLVRSIKTSLRSVLPTRTPSEDLLPSCLIEIENIINSRPLKYVEVNGDGLEALTTNHFLLGSSGGAKSYSNFDDDVHVLRWDYKRQQRITQLFWTRWVNEYLPEVSKRTQSWIPQHQFKKKKNDVVAISKPDLPYSWQLGRVIFFKWPRWEHQTS